MEIRDRAEVVTRCEALARELGTALARLPMEDGDPAVVEAVWQGEGLGALLWAVGLVEMAPYDAPFDHARLVGVEPEPARLREGREIEREGERARLWHWRARMTPLENDPEFELPAPWTSLQELVASVATRGHEQGLLPEPIGDDFPALGFAYRWATPPELAELFSIAYERHRALTWLCSPGVGWDELALDT